jgi:hypothetical protein
MITDDIRFDAGPADRDGKRLVIVTHLDRGELARDKIDCDSAMHRTRLVKSVIDRIGDESIDPATVDKMLVKAADDADDLDEADGADEQADGGRGPSVATQLVTLVEKMGVSVLHDSQEKAYARFQVGDHHEVAAIRSKRFKGWLSRVFYLQNSKAAGSQALADAITVIEGKALHEGAETAVNVRVAEHGGKLYIDLADDAWRVVEIDAAGWRVVTESPVLFTRPGAMLSLPVPVRGGSLHELRELVNVTDDDWPLVAAWLVAAIRARGPYPLLAITGEQGSAKSTTCRTLRRLIDPNTADLRSEPRDARDLMIAASNGHVVALDNLSGLRNDLSDALCRLATGGGFSTRALYSDGDEVIFNAMRPILANGIEELSTRSDLLDRCLLVNLPTIPETKRRSETDYWGDFDTRQPRILGAILDAVAAGLKSLPGVKLDKLPRMADFALWATAAEPGLGIAAGEFLAAYGRNRDGANDLAIEASPVAKAITMLVDRDGAWAGTAATLLDSVEGLVDDSTRRQRSWPKSPRSMGAELKRVAPNLRKAGIEVMTGLKGRRIELTRLGRDFCVPSVPSVPDAGNPEEIGVLAGTQNVQGNANPPRGNAKGTQTDPPNTPRKQARGTQGTQETQIRLPNLVTTPDDSGDGWEAA